MTQTNYTLACVERAATFMSEETRCGRSPDLDAIARAAGLSRFHFNRVYHLVTGETPRETMRRFRLAQAVDQLRDPEVSITEAAHAAGYGSSQSFAKAMHKVLDVSASQLRGDDERLGKAIEILAQPAAEDASLCVEIVRLEPFGIVTRRTVDVYPALNEHYRALFELAGGESNVQAILGQPRGDIGGSEDALAFDCGLRLRAPLDKVPSGFATRNIDGGRWLRTRHSGSYDGLPQALDRLYDVALRDAELRIAAEAPLFHYLDDPETTAVSELRTDLYLRVSP